MALSHTPTASAQAPSSLPSASKDGGGGEGRLLSFRTLHALVDRLQFAIKHGLRFGGKRDLYEALGYSLTIRPEEYIERYRRGGIARRIVNAYPETTWTLGTFIVENPDPDTLTPFESQVETLFKRLDVWGRILRADILACNGQYSALFIGAPGLPSTELPRLRSADEILYLTPVPEISASISKKVEGLSEISNPRYGLPLEYTLTLSNNQSIKVHWSRVIHVTTNPLESDIYSSPILESVWNYLDDADKLVGGGSEASWREMHKGLHINVDKDFNLSTEAETAFEEQIEAYRHGLERDLRTKGVEITPLGSTVPSFSGNTTSVLELIAGTLAIPKRILTGSERGELASSQDDLNFESRISERRGRFAVPLVNQLITRLMEYGALPEVETYEVVWPEEIELSEGEKAKIVGQIALANKNNGSIIMTNDEIRDSYYGLEPLEIEEVKEGTEDNEEEDQEQEEETEEDEVEEDETGNEEGGISVSTSSDRRIVILGGPRRGKSSLARTFRDQGIPTFCGDPRSLVKEPEDNVTYLPENLSWSDSSQYVVDNWLTQPGPWCCEGVSMVRALRKVVRADRVKDLDGIEIIVANQVPKGVIPTPKQDSMSKAVMTVWSEIADMFPGAKYVGENESDQVSTLVSKTPVIPGSSTSTLRSLKRRKSVSRYQVTPVIPNTASFKVIRPS